MAPRGLCIRRRGRLVQRRPLALPGRCYVGRHLGARGIICDVASGTRACDRFGRVCNGPGALKSRFPTLRPLPPDMRSICASSCVVPDILRRESLCHALSPPSAAPRPDEGSKWRFRRLCVLLPARFLRPVSFQLASNQAHTPAYLAATHLATIMSSLPGASVLKFP